MFGVYIHWPFCKSKCPYCDFFSQVPKSVEFDIWKKAYLNELENYAEILPEKKVSSIFFGGGTPSLMPVSVMSELIEKIKSLWQTSDNLEISMEGNPSSLSVEKLEQFKNAGINRISIGVQSLNELDLKFLGRLHTVQQAVDIVESAKKLFQNVSMDLIYARPNQTEIQWEKELSTALSFNLPHYSLYQLTIEEGTFFHRKGIQQMPEQQAKDLFLLTEELTQKAGVPRYEVSNHARPGFECRHNCLYWSTGEWIGIGPAAHGRYTQNNRFYADENPKSLSDYLNHIKDVDILNLDDKILEIVMMALRTKWGIVAADFKTTFNRPYSAFLNNKKIADFCADDMLIEDELGLRTTTQGLLILDYILSEIF